MKRLFKYSIRNEEYQKRNKQKINLDVCTSASTIFFRPISWLPSSKKSKKRHKDEIKNISREVGIRRGERGGD